MALPHLTAEHFEKDVEKSKLPVFVDFWADWCGPCRLIGPIFEDLSKDYAGKVSFMKLNVDEESDLASQFGVMSIPTLIVFSKGKEIERFVGAMNKATLKAKLDEALKQA